MDTKEAWDSFLHSGSVLDYLRYSAIRNANESDLPPEDNSGNEVQNQGTDTPTTEYR